MKGTNNRDFTKSCYRFGQTLKYLILIILSSFCSVKEEHNIFGQYVSKQHSSLERLRHPFDVMPVGMKLNVNKDSTFTFETCGTFALGSWRLKDDSIILNGKENKMKMDSSELKEIRFAYQIKKNGELHRIVYTDEKDSKKVLDYLVKVKKNQNNRSWTEFN